MNLQRCLSAALRARPLLHTTLRRHPHPLTPHTLIRQCSGHAPYGADHRELATAQQLLTGSIYSPGSPLFLPNGADMLNKLTALLRAHYPQFGFREVVTPNMYKRSLWIKSGHWDNYADDMFAVRGRGLDGGAAIQEVVDSRAGGGAAVQQDEEFGLKPMNCPGHCLLFASETRSYRELPVRFADFGSLHRNEVSGALSGLTRVRRFHQDDGHIFCRPQQIEREISRTMEFIELVYSDIFGLKDYRLVLSTRPEDKYIGVLEDWERAEAQLKAALDASGRKWQLSEGDGAFYGPKIDIILTDAHGKEHQTATIQLDFQLPQRFELKYEAPATSDGEISVTETPVLIHRAVLGSLERFLALLIEHYNGVYPFWLAPRPVAVLSVSQKPEELEYVEQVAAELSGYQAGSTAMRAPSQRPAIHVAKDTSARSLGKKIREAKTKGYNFIVVVGPKDVAKKTLAIQFSNQRDVDKGLEYLAQTMGSTTAGSDADKANVNIQTDARTVRGFFEKLQDEYM